MANSNLSVQPYLFFGGRCEEALEFYRGALGAEIVMLSRFKDAPDPAMAQPGMEEKVMHASFRVGETLLMASDGRCEGEAGCGGHCAGESGKEERRLRKRLAERESEERRLGSHGFTGLRGRKVLEGSLR